MKTVKKVICTVAAVSTIGVTSLSSNSNSIVLEESQSFDTLVVAAQKATNEKTPSLERAELMKNLRLSIEALSPIERMQIIDRLMLHLPWFKADAETRSLRAKDKITIPAGLFVVSALMLFAKNNRVQAAASVIGSGSAVAALYFHSSAAGILEVSAANLQEIRRALMEIRRASENELKLESLDKSQTEKQ